MTAQREVVAGQGSQDKLADTLTNPSFLAAVAKKHEAFAKEMYTLRFGLKPSAVYFNPTERCNLNCRYCYIPEKMRKHGRHMSQDRMFEALERLKRYFKDNVADVLRTPAFTKVTGRKVEDIVPCNRCAIRHFCGSPCPAEAHEMNGSMRRTGPSANSTRSRSASPSASSRTAWPVTTCGMGGTRAPSRLLPGPGDPAHMVFGGFATGLLFAMAFWSPQNLAACRTRRVIHLP